MQRIKFEMDMPPPNKPQPRLIGPLGLIIAAMGVIISLLQFIEHKKQENTFKTTVAEVCRLVETSDRRRLFECVRRQKE